MNWIKHDKANADIVGTAKVMPASLCGLHHFWKLRPAQNLIAVRDTLESSKLSHETM
jgi:hypothetical protein